ncbi:MAG: hypothetical protein C5B60_02435 [Chloroflexi bacterium]|nr:MAG: hypothetical protein C5B60_02435 [Chloroflexota bacterium]
MPSHSSEYLPFANAPNANVVGPAVWMDTGARRVGFVSGIARSDQLNQVWRQSASMTAAIAQFIAARLGRNVEDDGDVEALSEMFAAAIETSLRPAVGIEEAPADGRSFARRSRSWFGLENLRLDAGYW